MPIATILVEDSKTIREHLILSLEELTDVQVVAEAETPSQALACVAQHQECWSLMILDLFLKDGTGLEVLQACFNRLPHQQIVVLTSMATSQFRRLSLKLGADAVFDKTSEMDKFFDHCNLCCTA